MDLFFKHLLSVNTRIIPDTKKFCLLWNFLMNGSLVREYDGFYRFYFPLKDRQKIRSFYPVLDENGIIKKTPEFYEVSLRRHFIHCLFSRYIQLTQRGFVVYSSAELVPEDASARELEKKERELDMFD